MSLVLSREDYPKCLFQNHCGEFVRKKIENYFKRRGQRIGPRKLFSRTQAKIFNNKPVCLGTFKSLMS
jgi:hypothetical protein